MLFVPGNSKKMMDKIPSLVPGPFILDLGGSEPPKEKERARHLVGDPIRSTGSDDELRVRINDLSSPYAVDDLVAVIGENLSGSSCQKSRARTIFDASTR
jgi:citrate lyase beta subunit